MTVTLYHGDCLDILPTLEAGSVDAVVTDPPYGTTQCKWDSVIPLGPMWERLEGVAKRGAAIVLFGSQPFTSALVLSRPDWFKYCWVWEKTNAKGHLNAKIRPLMATEDICIFAESRHTYNPQGLVRGRFNNSRPAKARKVVGASVYGNEREFGFSKFTNYPRNLLKISNPNNGNVHPTEKPLELMEYLVKTYTNECDMVLDFAMGSGTTGVACVQTGRSFIGIEIDRSYFEIAKKRIEKAQAEMVQAEMALA